MRSIIIYERVFILACSSHWHLLVPICWKLCAIYASFNNKFRDVLTSFVVFHSNNVLLFCNDPLKVSRFNGRMTFELAK